MTLAGDRAFLRITAKNFRIFSTEHKRKQRFFTDGGEAAGRCGFFPHMRNIKSGPLQPMVDFPPALG